MQLRMKFELLMAPAGRVSVLRHKTNKREGIVAEPYLIPAIEVGKHIGAPVKFFPHGLPGRWIDYPSFDACIRAEGKREFLVC